MGLAFHTLHQLVNAPEQLRKVYNPVGILGVRWPLQLEDHSPETGSAIKEVQVMDGYTSLSMVYKLGANTPIYIFTYHFQFYNCSIRRFTHLCCLLKLHCGISQISFIYIRYSYQNCSVSSELWLLLELELLLVVLVQIESLPFVSSFPLQKLLPKLHFYLYVHSSTPLYILQLSLSVF